MVRISAASARAGRVQPALGYTFTQSLVGVSLATTFASSPACGSDAPRADAVHAGRRERDVDNGRATSTGSPPPRAAATRSRRGDVAFGACANWLAPVVGIRSTKFGAARARVAAGPGRRIGACEGVGGAAAALAGRQGVLDRRGLRAARRDVCRAAGARRRARTSRASGAGPHLRSRKYIAHSCAPPQASCADGVAAASIALVGPCAARHARARA